jgi:adenylate cyclase
MYEIERKFLVTEPVSKIVKNARAILHIEQRYLKGHSGEWSIRIRQTIRDNKPIYYQTMKRSIATASCIELETEITPEFYQTMAMQCGSALRKTRYEILVGEHIWEVDVFKDINLVMAEIELESVKEKFEMPAWAGKEVTTKKRYANKNLAKRIKKAV